MIPFLFAATISLMPTPEQLDTAVRVAAGEARGANDMAIAGVCHVIVNRLLIQKWGSHVQAVVTSPYQFSAYNEDDPNKRKVFSESYGRTKSYRHVRDICRTTLEGRLNGYFVDITNGADHYYSGTAVPYWAVGASPSATIGPFKFFNLRKRSRLEREAEATVRTENDPIARLIKANEAGGA